MSSNEPSPLYPPDINGNVAKSTYGSVEETSTTSINGNVEISPLVGKSVSHLDTDDDDGDSGLIFVSIRKRYGIRRLRQTLRNVLKQYRPLISLVASALGALLIAAILSWGLASIRNAASTALHEGDDNNNGGGESNVNNGSGTTNDPYAAVRPPPLSTLHPTKDLGFRSVKREGLAFPSKAWGDKYLTQTARRKLADEAGGDDDNDYLKYTPLPTNQWYLNLISHHAADNPGHAGNIAQAYAVPYIVTSDVPKLPPTATVTGEEATGTAKAMAIAGLSFHWPFINAVDKLVQMLYSERHGLVIGVAVDEENDDERFYTVDPDEEPNHLGVSLLWPKWGMRTHIVRGMPYATVRYDIGGRDSENNPKLPTLASGDYVTTITIDGAGGGVGTAEPVIPPSNQCDGFCTMPPFFPFGCAPEIGDVPGAVRHACGRHGGCAYIQENDAPLDPDQWCTFVGVDVPLSTPPPRTPGYMECGSFDGNVPPIQSPSGPSPVPMSPDGVAKSFDVEGELLMHFRDSDFSWVVFFSRPVSVKCYAESKVPSVSGVRFRLDVVEVLPSEEYEEEEELVVRAALVTQCTMGHADKQEHCREEYQESIEKNPKDYLDKLRRGVGVYSKSPEVITILPPDDDDQSADDEGRSTKLVFDWDSTTVADGFAAAAAAMSSTGTTAAATTKPAIRALRNAAVAETETNNESQKDELIMFALPHHMDLRDTPNDDDDNDTQFCTRTLHGRTCLVRGSTWNLSVSHGPPQSFHAARPPVSEALSELSVALRHDVDAVGNLDDPILRGAADTYFPGKLVGRIARVVEIVDELCALGGKGGCGLDDHARPPMYSDPDDGNINSEAAGMIKLPDAEDVNVLIDKLQAAIEIWLTPGGKATGGAESEFLYDTSWGGFVNCGCNWVDGHCTNEAPSSCPALADVNVNFGNGWYNDHHYHYGYQIYAAAVVAKHRPEWGKEFYDRVLLYVRDIANPSRDDTYFATYRMKDWYLGNSWASGLMSAERSPTGRNEESSSEAIAAFEAIALYGSVMMDIFDKGTEKHRSATELRNVGELLTATEIYATQRYWQVKRPTSPLEDGERGMSAVATSYPSGYKKLIVAMVHSTMVTFQTWFSPQAVVSYGIQIMPLTAVIEQRDTDRDWIDSLYAAYAESCAAAGDFCVDQGWNILKVALLAETGRIDEAIEMALAVPEVSFASEGGNGNTLSNLLWFVSTRKKRSD